MSVFSSMQINASGLSLERLKMDTISTNIANINTIKTEDGGPYKRKEVIFEENLKTMKDILSSGIGKRSMGVKVTGIRESEEDFKFVYDPTNPEADENGYITLPNVNLVDEMIALINTQRTYEANVTALNTSKSILKKALEISK